MASAPPTASAAPAAAPLPQEAKRSSTFIFKDRFSVSVRLVSARDLIAGDFGGKSDPYCIVEILGKTYRTKTIKKTLNPEWNEQAGFVFHKTPDTLIVHVFDQDAASKDDILGRATVNLRSLWNLKSHPTGTLEAELPLEGVAKGSIHLVVTCSKVQEVVGRTPDDRSGEFEIDELHSLVDLNLMEGKYLKNKDSLGQGDPFALIECGLTCWKTKTCDATTNPSWNQRCPIWVKKANLGHIIKVSVYDEDPSKRDLIGVACIPLTSIPVGAPCEFWIPLIPAQVFTDADLSTLKQKLYATEVPDFAAGSEYQLGFIHVKASRKEKSAVAAEFFDTMIRDYDVDKNGTLEEDELVHMLHTLGSDLHDDAIHALFEAADVNKDGSISRQELLALFESDSFRFGAVLKSLYLRMSAGADGAQDVMMQGVYNPQDIDNPRDMIDNQGSQVQIYDRESGMVVKENIPVYIKSTLRVLYRTFAGRKTASSNRIRKTMASLTKSQGIKMDDPASAKNILSFINTHQLIVEEVERPLDEFKSFNEFFYRTLKPGARVSDFPDDDKIALSPADCRMTVFKTIDDAKRIWVKGEKFTLSNLLGPADPDGKMAAELNGGSLVIARLAPQDYHRWHFPVSGVCRERTMIDGDYNTVNPIAVRMNVNVYTENKRCICPIDTKEFGLVVLIAVGATMVGSINFEPNTDKGSKVKKFQSHGYFAFGGSTTLVLFKPGAISLDKDLVQNSDNCLETLAKVGNHIGVSTGKFSN